MTPDQLNQATRCGLAAAVVFAEPLTTAIRRYQVRRVPEFLAQIAAESGRLRILQENLYYVTPDRLMQVFGLAYFPTVGTAMRYTRDPEKLANYVYDDRNRARRNKLGNLSDGDGWKYRGRGLKQLTGRWNYADYQADTNVHALDVPDLLLDPVFAADSAAWFWSTRNCDTIADNTEALTRRINGGINGLAERIQLTKCARDVFSVV